MGFTGGARRHNKAGGADTSNESSLQCGVLFITCDDVVSCKPDPEGVFTAMKTLGVSKDQHHQVVMIGDHHVDIQAGRAAGVSTVGMIHGFGTERDLKKSGATVLCDSISSLQMELG